MKLFSLGGACQVKYHIDKHVKNEKTNFFDWLITNFKSVLYILENIDNPKLLNKDNFSDKPVFMERESWVETKHKIENKIFKMISVHDFPSDVPYLDYMDDFLLKYKNRLDRLKNILFLDENIHMIHCVDHQFSNEFQFCQEDIIEFFNILQKINPNHKCFLHIAIAPKYSNVNTDELTYDNTFIYKLTKKENVEEDWTNENFNWEIIFDNIFSIG
jgi:hypothetical protein